jgi:hypothetical protein
MKRSMDEVNNVMSVRDVMYIHMEKETNPPPYLRNM